MKCNIYIRKEGRKVGGKNGNCGCNEIIVFNRKLDRKSEGEGEGIESDRNACVNLLYYDFEISSSIY